MNKLKLAQKINNKFNTLYAEGPSTEVVKTIINMTISSIIDELKETGVCFVDGLGTFKTKEVKKRKTIIKSPVAKEKQNQEIEIGGYKKIVFRNHASIKKEIN